MDNSIALRTVRWTGTNAEYHHIHYLVMKRFGRPKTCEHCGTRTAKRYEWANKSYEYRLDRADWLRLCKSCHAKYDHVPKPLAETCQKGHRYEESNSYYRADGTRFCKPCFLARKRAWYRAKRGDKFVDYSKRGLPRGVYRVTGQDNYMARVRGQYLGVFATVAQAEEAINQIKERL